MKRIPKVQTPVVDYVVYVLPLAAHMTQEESDKALKPVLDRLEKEYEEGTCERGYSSRSRYREKFTILLPGGSKAYVQLGATRPDYQNGGLRIAVNPARFTDGSIAHMHSVLKRVVGKDYKQLCMSPQVNRIDVAVDIEHLDLGNVLVSYARAGRGTVFGKRMKTDGWVETYNFGSQSSDYMSAVYDKRVERIHAAALNLLKSSTSSDTLKKNAIKRLKRAHDAFETTRVEVRGMKLRGLPLWELHQQPNRFSRFHFVDLCQHGAELPEWLHASFQALCEQRGVKAALANFKRTPYSAAVREFWESRQPSWWEPESMWEEACDALRKTGLFPDRAFVKPVPRNIATAG